MDEKEPADGAPARRGSLPRRVTERVRRLPRLVVVAIAAVLALAVAGGVTVALTAEDAESTASPVELTRRFLEAVRAKDIRGAFALTDVPQPTDTPDGTFLDPRALRGDWRVVGLREQPRRATTTPTATVDYTLRGPGDLAGHGELLFAKADGERWRVGNPTVKVTIPYSPLRYVDVNAMHVAREYDDRRATPAYALLPGLYDFYGRDTTQLVTESPKLRFVTQTRDGDGAGTVQAPALEDLAWWDAIDQHVAARIDECARKPALYTPGCPFGAAESITVRTSGEPVPVTAIQDIAWTVLEPSLVDRKPAGRQVLADYLPVVSADGQAGRVRLSATGLTPANQRIAFTAECDIATANVLRAGVAADGSLALWAGGPPYRACGIGDQG